MTKLTGNKVIIKKKWKKNGKTVSSWDLIIPRSSLKTVTIPLSHIMFRIDLSQQIQTIIHKKTSKLK
jgi:hypothetical protein